MAESQNLFTRAQARATGLTNHQVDEQLAAGSLVAVRRGVLQSTAIPAPGTSGKVGSAGTPRSGGKAGSGDTGGKTSSGDTGGKSSSGGQSGTVGARGKIILAGTGGTGRGAGSAEIDVPIAVRAALLASPRRELVISHATAAQLLGLPAPLGGWPEPHFTATSGSTRHRGGVQIRVTKLADAEVVQHQGVWITSPSRTVADCLRSLPGQDGLAIVDAALHRDLVTAATVSAVLQDQARWPGVSLARQVLALADPRRESPLESWSAWCFACTGVPAPQWQVEIRDPRNGDFIGRADCWWSGGLVGEADGRSKYALAAAERGGEHAVFEVLQAERQREQRMREVGAEVIRWSTGEVLKAAPARRLAQRIKAAIALAQDGARFTGTLSP